MSARFNRRQIVWAKIEPYPWWPGKIINIHIQSNEIVYKILFFADPTYAYLQQKQLIAHGQFDRTLNIRFGHDSRLHKASKMADEAYGKMHHGEESKEAALELAFSKISSKSTRQSISRPSPPPEEPPCDENSNQQGQQIAQGENQGSKQVVDLMRMEETSVTPVEKEAPESNNLPMNIRQITTDNIFQILQGRSRNQQSQSYNYQNRKEVIRYKFQLKTKLLERYNLLHISEEQPCGGSRRRSDIAQQARKILRNKRELKREKTSRRNNGSGSSSIVRQKCMRKLYAILKKCPSGADSSNSLRQFVVSAMGRISRCSQQNQLKYQTLFMSVVKLVSEESRSRGLGEHIINVQNYLERIQNEKHEDEEGSRMTQLSVPSH